MLAHPVNALASAGTKSDPLFRFERLTPDRDRARNKAAGDWEVAGWSIRRDFQIDLINAGEVRRESFEQGHEPEHRACINYIVNQNSSHKLSHPGQSLYFVILRIVTECVLFAQKRRGHAPVDDRLRRSGDTD
jgi:hypothetical protein